MRLTPDILLQGYAVGIFPMAESRVSGELYWIDPERRGVLPIDDFHLSRSLRKTVRRGVFEIRVDTAFEQVVAECAAPDAGREDSWINPEIERLYAALFRRGHAHSVEAWREGKLVGGLYGVALGGAFFGESMFSRATDASKVALVHLIARLRAGGFSLLDTQFVTTHLSRFGAREIPRALYRRRLQAALRMRASFDIDPSVELARLVESDAGA